MDNNTQTEELEPSDQNSENSAPRSTAPQNPPWSNQDIQSLIRDTVDKLIPRRSDEIFENNRFNRTSTSRGSCSREPYRRDSRSHSRSRTRKRNRSPSSEDDYSHNHSYQYDGNVYSYESDSYDSEESVSDDSGPKLNTKESPPQYVIPVPTGGKCEKVFQENDDTYMRFESNKHNHVDVNKILWNSVIYSVKWHPTKRAFCIIPNVVQPTEFLYGDPTVGHQSTVGLFDVQHNIKENPGQNRKCFDTKLNPSSGLSKYLQLMISSGSSILQGLYNGDEAAASKAIPNSPFATVSMANFAMGWPFETTYIAWAKDINLSLTQAGSTLTMKEIPKVTTDFLNKERLTRSRLVDQFTSFKKLELLEEHFKHMPAVASAIRSIAQQFSLTLKELTITWMSAKMEVRKIIIQGEENLSSRRDNLTSRQLLQSNMWDPNIFPQEIIDKLKQNGPDKDIGAMINPFHTAKRTVSFKNRSLQRKGYKRYNKERRFERRYEDNQSRPPFRDGYNGKNNKKREGKTHKKTNSSNRRAGNQESKETSQDNQNGKYQKSYKKGSNATGSSGYKNKNKNRK